MGSFLNKVLGKIVEGNLRPAPPTALTTLNQEVAQLVAPFASPATAASANARNAGGARLFQYISERGGLNPTSGDGDPLTYVVQEVMQHLFFAEQGALYAALAQRYPDNGRGWKLLGLASYWNAFRWNGTAGIEYAKRAFNQCLLLPNREHAHTPFRVRQWLHNVEFMEAKTGGDDAATQRVNAIANQEAAAFWATQRQPYTPIAPDERWLAIERECVNTRGCDYTTGEAIVSTISRQLVGAGVGERINDGQSFVWNIVFLPDGGSLFLVNPSSGGLTQISFVETPLGSSNYKIRGN